MEEVMSMSLLDMSKEELLKECESIKGKLNERQNELEQKNQKIYELQRDLARAIALEKDYIQEIEILQDQDKIEFKKLTDRIQSLEEICASLRDNKKEELQLLESELTAKANELEMLNEQLQNLQKIVVTGNVSNEAYDKLIAENDILKERIGLLEASSSDFKDTFEELQLQSNYLEVELKSKNSELEDLQENYSVKAQDLQIANDTIETLQEEVVIIKSELDMLKNKSMEHVTQGNSLFAEVDDRRLQLQKNMTVMKEHYVDMKRERANLLNQITTLEKKNMILVHRTEQDVVEMEKLYCLEIGICKERILTLEKLIEQYRSKLEEKQGDIGASTKVEQIDEFFNYIIKSKDEEIESLMKKLNVESLSQMSLFNNLKICKKELGASKLSVQQSLNENTKLRSEIELMKLNNPDFKKPCQECATRKNRFGGGRPLVPESRVKKEEKKPEGITINVNTFLKNAKSKWEEKKKEVAQSPAPISLAEKVEEEKENVSNEHDQESTCGAKKAVRFTEDTVDPKTDKKYYRPKGKILSCPVTYITCKKKE